MARRAPIEPSMQTFHLTAPTGGLNTVSPASAMGPGDCMVLYNLIASEYGLRGRLGSREFVTGLTGQSDNLVRSIHSFVGSSGDGSKDRVFACTSTGIWDVTTSTQTPGVSATARAWAAGTAYNVGERVTNDTNRVYECDTAGTSAGAGGPTGTGADIVDNTARWDYIAASGSVTPRMAFATKTGDAGYGVSRVVVTSAGHFLLYCDEVNGLYVYTESTSSWAKISQGAGATQIDNVDPATFVHVNVFKNRVWFTKKDTAQAWYLAAGAIYGAATSFEMGRDFKAGGHLVGTWNWTRDGGAGMDDALIAVSGGGDVLIYEGTDPASAATWGLKGDYQIGPPPKGRDIAISLGGDAWVLSRTGAVPMSKLVLGGAKPSEFPTWKVGNLINSAMLTKSSLRGWSIRLHPEDNAVLITVPTSASVATEQLAMSLWSVAQQGEVSWSRYRDLPIYSSVAHQGKLYYGTTDGKVGINDGYLDGRTLANPSAYRAVQWSMIGAFSELGSPVMKQVGFIRPSFLSDGSTPQYKAEARYRYDLTEVGSVSGGTSGTNTWDSGLWDTAVWSGSYGATEQVGGATGMGVRVAIACRGTAVTRTILLGFDVTFMAGGFL